MKYLTAKYIIAAIAKDPRFDTDVEFDEPGKAIVWLADGHTWDANDGNRTVEGFIISSDNCDNAPHDTIAYWQQRVASIEEIC